MQPHSHGISAALASNILFGVLYLYAAWLQPLSGTEVFLWRMVTMAAALWLMVCAGKGLPKLRQFLQQTGRDKRKWFWILLPTPVLASQLWLFMWGPVNGYGVDIAIGYFLFPLTMTLCGRLFFGEKLNRLQQLALLLAAAGVFSQMLYTRSLSWTTLWVCLTYPIYYIPRKMLDVPALIGLLIDLSLIAPIALIALLLAPPVPEAVSANPYYWLMIPLLGIISAAALQLNLYAARALPVNVFGMLSYLEPLLLFVLAIVVLGNTPAPEALISYGLIALGLACSMANSWRSNRISRRIGTSALQT